MDERNGPAADPELARKFRPGAIPRLIRWPHRGSLSLALRRQVIASFPATFHCRRQVAGSASAPASSSPPYCLHALQEGCPTVNPPDLRAEERPDVIHAIGLPAEIHF